MIDIDFLRAIKNIMLGYKINSKNYWKLLEMQELKLPVVMNKFLMNN